jgi:hypothetical protein
MEDYKCRLEIYKNNYKEKFGYKEEETDFTSEQQQIEYKDD